MKISDLFDNGFSADLSLGDKNITFGINEKPETTTPAVPVPAPSIVPGVSNTALAVAAGIAIVFMLKKQR